MEKSPEAFRTISEVAGELDLPQHVLRFWESRFTQIKPMKRAGGRRYYRPEDIDLLRGVRHLLYNEGYTIRGVQRILSSHGVRHVSAIGRGGPEAVAALAMVPREPSDDAEEAAAEGREQASLAVSAARAISDDDFDDTDPLGPVVRTDRLIGDDTVGGGMETDGPVPRDIRVGDEPEHKGGAFRFFDRLRGEKGAEGGLSRDDVRRLQATLFDLLECKRLLDQTR